MELVLPVSSTEQRFSLGDDVTLETPELNFWPDQSLGRIPKKDGHGDWLFATSSGKTVLLERQDKHLAIVDSEFLVSKDGHGGRDAYRGISSVVKIGNKWIAAYHAEDHVEMSVCPGSNANGFWASIGIVEIEMRNDGVPIVSNTEEGLYTPTIRSQKEKVPYSSSEQGIGDPCLTMNHEGDALLCYYTDWCRSWRNGCVNICVAQSPLDNGTYTGVWKKWDGKRFDINCDEDVPIIYSTGTDVLDAHVSYIEKHQQYTMVFSVFKKDEDIPEFPDKSGIYAATSTDGVNWCDPEVLWPSIFPIPREHREIAVHPTLFLTNEEMFLVVGYSKRYDETPPFSSSHKLIARKVHF